LEIITPRLVLALLAYVSLAVMVWWTMQDDRIRLVTFAILALFAFKTVLHAVREQQARQNDSE
jgi:membrane protein implicated in regulation of membrane protease activity